MPGLLPDVDPDGLLEFSVVYTDRALNHMSQRFVGVMQDILHTLKEVYHAPSAALVPGSGSFGMEAVVRQFVQPTDTVLIVRNGWFSYRWTQILEAAGLGEDAIVCKARPQVQNDNTPPAWAPCPVDEVAGRIRAEKPKLVFVPHVETASGILLPDDYLRDLSAAAHEVGALVVLDCVASGAMWVNMQATGVDVLISAPQKGWSGSPCCAMVMLSERAHAAMQRTRSSSFACDLKKWTQIAEGYEQGNHSYHSTMPTDALVRLRDVMLETRAWGFENARAAQMELGDKVRTLLESHGFASVAAEGFKAPCVVVSHTTDPELQNAKKFLALGLQTAAGVPLQCDEGADFSSFRIGLFGLEKWQHVDRTVGHLRVALEAIKAGAPQTAVA